MAKRMYYAVEFCGAPDTVSDKDIAREFDSSAARDLWIAQGPNRSALQSAEFRAHFTLVPGTDRYRRKSVLDPW